MKRRLITVSLLSACALLLPASRAAAQGQTGRITGTITSTESNQPIQGVRVTLLGTQLTVTSNPQGKYTIAGIAPGNYRIRASAIGYTPVIVDSIPVAAGQTASADIALKHQTVELERVVTVGYGTLTKRDVTGAIGQVSGDQIKAVPTTNAIDAIKGKVPGVDIVATGYKPGEGVRVRIRGTRSLTASNDPLYVLDGIPMAGGIGDLSPADIESIEVLKDASATAIYGSRGANGVVLITSRRGQAGNTRVTYDTYAGAQDVTRKIDVFGPEEYANYKREAYRTSGLYKCAGVVSQSICPEGDAVTFYSEELAALKNGTFTDWQDLITRQGSLVEHRLGVQGGNDRAQYSVSGELQKQIGVVMSQGFDRKQMRVSIEGQAKDRFRIGGSALYVRSTQAVGRDNGLFDEAQSDSPLSVPYDSAGNIVFKPTPDAQRDNPLSDINNWQNDNLRNRIFGTMFATVNLLPGLDYRVNFGPDMTFNRNGIFIGAQTQSKQGAGNQSEMREQRTFDYTLDNLVTYKRQFGTAHKIDATALYSIEKQNFEEQWARGDNLPSESFKYFNLGAAAQVNGISSQTRDWALQSYMARLNYTLLDRYLLTLTSRIDGSSRLAEGNKFASFPSIAVGWRVLDEATNQRFGPVNNLKVRASYGTTGNTSVDPYQTLDQLNRTVYSFGGTGAFGYAPNTLANPNLKWEKTATFDAGVDFGVMDGRISGTLDYYRANTTDLLMNRSIPYSLGYQSITQNIGATRNSGIELALSAIALDGWHGIRWSNDITWTKNKNEIVSLAGGATSDLGNLWFVGSPINGGGNNVWRDYVFNGIWQTSEAAQAAVYGRRPGEIKIVDVNNDQKFNDADKVILGNSYPKWTGSYSTRVDYKFLDFGAQAITRQGFTIRNDVERGNTLAGRYNGVKVDFWTPDNPSNTAPRPDKNTESPFFSDARGYEDGSFVKIRNITVGATVPERYLTRVGAQSLRLYVTAQDPFLFTDTKVIDPEAATGKVIPAYRTLLIGGNFGF
ncbi:MAG: SusC/RagA family TonB-linked outer membrane protein [Gemmatimonadetes bacterium]|nr:MAG: SusC/RagA family TonB-linked outer membrane protein [Gemmatimonadota bacterium]